MPWPIVASAPALNRFEGTSRRVSDRMQVGCAHGSDTASIVIHPGGALDSLTPPRPAIDGTGWVQEPVDRSPLTAVGQVFRMGMYHANHPDGGYQVANKVEVLDPPHAIGWLTGEEKDDGRLEFGGWLWRYDLVPLGPSDTEITLTYDWSAVPQHIREYIQFPPFGPEHLTNSLHHLAELAVSTSRA